jgi:hypothetical protein
VLGILLTNQRSRQTLVALAHKISLSLKSIRQREEQEEVARNLSIMLEKLEEHRRAPSPSSSFYRRSSPSPIVYAGRHRLKARKISSSCHPDAIAKDPVKSRGPERQLRLTLVNRHRDHGAPQSKLHHPANAFSAPSIANRAVRIR